MKIEGFTQEEIDFMESVPDYLRSGYEIVACAMIYNCKFGTNLTEDQFHDKFDDYMIQNNRTEKKNDSNKEKIETGFVEEFIKAKHWNADVCVMLDVDRSIRELLNDYEEFRNNKTKEQVKEVFDQVQSELDNFSWFAENFTNNFKFLSSWRFW